MKPDHPVTFKPETAADAWLGLLAARGIEYLFANGGTDFAPLVEAYAKGQKLGWRLPQIVIVPHENMGVAMAHGYAMVTGRPQAMMVHVGVGTANSLNGLINASRQNVPILFTAGRTPITEGHGPASGGGALLGVRNNYIHWAQEHFDQGGMLREFVKWDYELRHAEQVETVIDRALAIAKSEPQGPVYVTLPREVLASDFSSQKFAETSTIAPASPPAADPEALEEAAKLLGAAQYPLLITASGGRTQESARAIEQLAQMLAVPVVHYRPRHLALSTEHPMHCGWDPHALLKEADVVLVVECDVPWIPKEGKPKPEARVIHIGPDPLFASYPLRGFRADIALTGAVAPTLQVLWRAAQKQAVSVKQIEERRKTISAVSEDIGKGRAAGVEPMPAAITGKWLSACVNKVLGDETILVNEYPTVLEEMVIKRAGPLLRQPLRRRPRLGHGCRARRQARLARQDRDLRGRRRRVHVRQPDRGALRIRGDAAAGALHHRQQRALGGGAPLDAFDLSERSRRRDQAAAVRHARALAALRARGAGERRLRRARHRADQADAGAREGPEGGEGRKAAGRAERLPGSELR